MDSPNANLVKTTRPRVGNILNRPRLFKRLDKTSHYPITWISGPGGAGKTTLLASYIESSNSPCLWYQIDAGDQDTATFFHYLGLAAKQASPRKRKPLPHLTPEYLASIEVFAQRYFEQLFARLGAGSVLVFDNFQELPGNSPLHAILSQLHKVVPESCRVFFISRADPSTGFARLRAKRALATVHAEDLKLTDEEINAIVARHDNGSGKLMLSEQLRERLHGWAAGLVLILECSRTGILDADSLPEEATESVFDYFAGEIFDKADSQTQDFLLQTVFLPSTTVEMAKDLTGLQQSAEILEYLNRHQYFTNKNAQKEAMYQYHPLFGEFLRDRAKQRFSASQLISINARAAMILDKAGHTDHAAALYIIVEDWSALSRLIRENARFYLQTGRLQTIESWLISLPPAAVKADPWLQFQLGQCRLPFDPAESREHFSLAYALFEQADDAPGLFLTWSAAIDSYVYEWGDFTSIDPWIAALPKLLDRFPEFPSLLIEASVVAGMFSALMFRQPDNPDLAYWESRAHQLLDSDLDVGHKLHLGSHLILYYTSWIGEGAKAQLLLNQLKPIADSTKMAPQVRLLWSYAEATHYWITAECDTGIKLVDEAIEFANNTGLHILDARMLAIGVLLALNSDNPKVAYAYIDRMAQLIPTARPVDLGYIHYTAYLGAMVKNNAPQALQHAEAALVLSKKAGVPFAQCVYHNAVGQAHHELNEDRLAGPHLGQGARIARAMHSAAIEYAGLMHVAECALSRGKKKWGLAMLGKALAIGRKKGYLSRPLWRPQQVAKLCIAALENNIEVEYVHHWIRSRKIQPKIPPLHLENWPWSLKIFTLGRFSIVHDDNILQFTGRAQRKPLELLKVLIAHGGRNVPEPRFTEALWPDAEGDAAHRSFDTTLHRLRKLIPVDQLILVQDGRVSLNEAICWVDTWATEQVITQLNKILKVAATSNNDDELEQLSTTALRYYQGNFLDADVDASWAVAPRERLRDRFLRLLLKMGQHWESTGHYNQAAGLYQQGIHLDALAEDFYRHLMACHYKQGRSAEAVVIYQRCHRALAEGLGIEPSVHTQSILAGLQTHN